MIVIQLFLSYNIVPPVQGVDNEVGSDEIIASCGQFG